MLNRRTLLKETGIGAGLAASAAALPRPSPRPRRAIKKALKYGMIGVGSTLLEKFAAAKQVGFDGVEMDSPNGFETQAVLDAKAATGIEIPGVVDSVHWQHTLGDPSADVRARGVQGLETALRDCAAYGGTTVLLVPGVVNEHLPYHLVYERSQTEIRKVLPLAEELGVKIAFENVWNNFLLSPLEAARYCDELGPQCGWFLDVGNLVRFAWPEHWVQALGKRILKLDVKEYSRKKQNDEGLWKGFQVEIGDGDCGWPRVMKALDEVGYEGWASAEVGGGGLERMAEILTRMTAALEA
ncbi:MAG: sugar phosphate isomerase/epimerase [Planctomycetota bacterium]|nr:sugar phosphate isomerase/epimerase [Planctomycetota bacterium]